MFTGIIDHCGRIKRIEDIAAGKRLWISCQFENLIEGESISVDGACLTVVSPQQQEFACDVSPETVKLTKIAQAKLGDKVNLERALRLSDRLGGHFVSGHVDQMCQVSKIQQLNAFTHIHFSGLAADSIHLLVKKGSITINGVSLTLNAVSNSSFEVMLIPETLEKTNLSDLRENNLVNIEYDMMAKLVSNYLDAKKSPF
jgi:riboflavin synthase